MTHAEVVTFMAVIAAALAFAEWQTRTVATIRWVLLAVIWLLLLAMLLWTVSYSPMNEGSTLAAFLWGHEKTAYL